MNIEIGVCLSLLTWCGYPLSFVMSLDWAASSHKSSITGISNLKLKVFSSLKHVHGLQSATDHRIRPTSTWAIQLLHFVNVTIMMPHVQSSETENLSMLWWKSPIELKYVIAENERQLFSCDPLVIIITNPLQRRSLRPSISHVEFGELLHLRMLHLWHGSPPAYPAAVGWGSRPSEYC